MHDLRPTPATLFRENELSRTKLDTMAHFVTLWHRIFSVFIQLVLSSHGELSLKLGYDVAVEPHRGTKPSASGLLKTSYKLPVRWTVSQTARQGTTCNRYLAMPRQIPFDTYLTYLVTYRQSVNNLVIVKTRRLHVSIPLTLFQVCLVGKRALDSYEIS